MNRAADTPVELRSPDESPFAGWWIAALAGIVALAWRAWEARFGETFYDGHGYILIARGLLEGRFATPYISPGILFHHDFLYPAAIAAAGLWIEDLAAAARVVNVLAGALLVLPVYGLARDVFGRSAAAFAAALVVFHPTLVTWSANAYSEPLYVLLGATGCWWLHRAGARASMTWALLAGVAFGAAATTRLQGVALAVAAIGAWLVAGVLGRTRTGRTRLALGCAVATALVVAPLVVHVRTATPATTPGKSAQEFHKKNATFEASAWFDRERSLSWDGTRLAWLDAASRYGVVGFVRDHPAVYARRVVRDAGVLIYEAFNHTYFPAVLALACAFAIVTDVRSRNGRAGFWWWVVGIVAGTIAAIALAAVAMDRYLAIVAPFAVLVAGAGFAAAARALAGGHPRPTKGAARPVIVSIALGVGTLAAYGDPRVHDDPEPIDRAVRRVAAWVAPHLDPSRTDVVLANHPAVAGTLGERFLLLPSESPERVGAYARHVGADVVLLDGWFLDRFDDDARHAWEHADLAPAGLRRIGRHELPERRDPNRIHILFDVLPHPETIAPARPGPPPTPHVVWLSIDALRSDRATERASRAGIEPSIVRSLQEAGVRLDGVVPSSLDRVDALAAMLGARPAADDGVATGASVAERFRRAGYRTAAWTAGRGVHGEAGFADGFDSFRADLARLDDTVLDAAGAWLRDCGATPCFLWLETAELDAPWAPGSARGEPPRGPVIADPDRLLALADTQDAAGLTAAFWRLGAGETPSLERFDETDRTTLRRLYDREVDQVDRALGAWLERLERDGPLRDAVVVLTAPRNLESFDREGERDHAAHAEHATVSWFAMGPGIEAASAVDGTVSASRFAATLLDLAGIARDGGTAAVCFRAPSSCPIADPVDTRPRRGAKDGGGARSEAEFPSGAVATGSGGRS